MLHSVLSGSSLPAINLKLLPLNPGQFNFAPSCTAITELTGYLDFFFFYYCIIIITNGDLGTLITPFQ